MKTIESYLFFDGNCRQALEFYASCLGANLHLLTYGEGPGNCPEVSKDRIMHARLEKGTTVLMASDTAPGIPLQQGNNFSLNLNCESLEEIEQLFNAISEKGNVTMPLHDAFWGARFGMLTDQFGVNWMFNFEQAKQSQGAGGH